LDQLDLYLLSDFFDDKDIGKVSACKEIRDSNAYASASFRFFSQEVVIGKTGRVANQTPCFLQEDHVRLDVSEDFQLF
jgi:hypothetical protein